MKRTGLDRIIAGGQEGHAAPLLGTLIGGVGAILLAIGAANHTGALAIVGGVVLAVGLTATALLNHVAIDYDLFKRLDDLSK